MFKKFLFSMFLFCSLLFAQEDVFLSLLLKPEPFISTPGNTTVITTEEIEKSNASSVVELLEMKKGIFVKDSSGNGTRAEVDLRGFGETCSSNILVLVDGRRVNNVDMSNINWRAIPVNQVEKIEIIYGEGSVLYGDNASAGVINIITKKSKESGVELSLKYGSFSTRDFSVDLSKNLNKNLFLGFSFNNLYSDGFRKNNKFAGNNFSVTGFGKLKENIQIYSRVDFHNNEFGLPGFLNEDDYEKGNLKETYSPEDKAQTPFDFNFQNIFSVKTDIGKTDINLNYKNRTSKTDWISWFWFDTRNTNDYQVTLRHSIDTLLYDLPAYFQIGADFFNSKYKIESFAEEERETKLQEQEIQRTTLGFYFLNKLDLFHNTNLTAGIRTEELSDNFNSSEKVSERVYSYQVSYGWVYRKKLNLSLGFVNSYRFPKTDEYYSVFTGLNRTLKPQNNYQTSLNAKYLVDKNYSVAVTFFNMDIKNEIFYNPVTWTNENYESTNHRGIEFETIFRPFRFMNGTLSYSWTIAKLNYGDFKDKEIPLVPKNVGSLVLEFLPREYLSLNLSTKYVDERWFGSDFGNVQGKLDSYSLVDISIVFKKNMLSLKFGVNNLFDTKYSPNGYSGVFYPGPARNYFVSFGYRI